MENYTTKMTQLHIKFARTIDNALINKKKKKIYIYIYIYIYIKEDSTFTRSTYTIEN